MSRRRRSNKPPREARIEANPHYYALNTHRSYRAFGPAEWRDDRGRQYRLSGAAGGTASHVQLDVKLPTHAVPWFYTPYDDRRVRLTSADGQHERIITIEESYIMGPKHRSGHVIIPRSEWDDTAGADTDLY